MANENYWALDRDELRKVGLSSATVEQIASAVERDMELDYVTLSYAGNPENNVKANYSHLCVDTTNDYLYYNFTVGADTGWTKIVV